jgi:hypothetical protein
MIYTKNLPKMLELDQLSRDIEVYPINGLGVWQHAVNLDYDDEIIDFVSLFSNKKVFFSRSDFLNCCILLKRLLKEELVSEPVVIRSRQD